MTTAPRAFHGEIRITLRGRAYVVQGSGGAPASPRVHCGERLAVPDEHEAACLARGNGSARGWRRRVAQKLAVCGVTEFAVRVGTASGEKRSGGDGLRLHGFEGRGWRHFGGDNGGDCGLGIHSDNRLETVRAGGHEQCALVVPANAAGDGEGEVDGISAARCSANGWHGSAVEQEMAGLKKNLRAAMIVFVVEHNLHIARFEDDGCILRAREPELGGMKKSEDADVHGLSGCPRGGGEERRGEASPDHGSPTSSARSMCPATAAESAPVTPWTR